VSQIDQRLCLTDFYAELFGELALERIETPLTRSALAARKLPVASHMLAFWPAADKYQTIAALQNADQDADFACRCVIFQFRLP
jgi:hypothetical protein